jgi:hypothetical protein
MESPLLLAAEAAASSSYTLEPALALDCAEHVTFNQREVD